MWRLCRKWGLERGTAGDVLEWELSRCSCKSSGWEAGSPPRTQCFSELTWQGHPFPKRSLWWGTDEQRGSAPAEGGDEWVAIKPMASKRFPSDRKTLSSHSQFYFIPFHLIFHIMGAVKEILWFPPPLSPAAYAAWQPQTQGFMGRSTMKNVLQTQSSGPDTCARGLVCAPLCICRVCVCVCTRTRVNSVCDKAERALNERLHTWVWVLTLIFITPMGPEFADSPAKWVYHAGPPHFRGCQEAHETRNRNIPL